MTDVVDIVLLALLVVSAFALVRVRNLFAVAMMFGIFSLLCASLFVVLDAPDVALTEAAVGAGLSVVLMLGTLALVGREERTAARARRPWLALTVVVLTGAALIYGTLDMPHFGDPDAPAHNHVAPRYLQDSGAEIGIPNVVASVLASYRGFDTLGETFVIFAAGVGVLLLLGAGGVLRRSQPDAAARDTMSEHVVLRVVSKLLIPMILLFALYVQMHGEYSPGGGFQAGVLFAASIVLYALVFGLDAAQLVVPPRIAHRLVASGALLYAAVGVWAMAVGGNFLEYKVLHGVAATGESIGIIVIELGVGITVMGTATTLYYAFAGRRR